MKVMVWLVRVVVGSVGVRFLVWLIRSVSCFAQLMVCFVLGLKSCLLQIGWGKVFGLQEVGIAQEVGIVISSGMSWDLLFMIDEILVLFVGRGEVWLGGVVAHLF